MDNSTQEFIDFINVLSFVIGIENLKENNIQIKQIEEHLITQDKQYQRIIELLEESRNGKRTRAKRERENLEGRN